MPSWLTLLLLAMLNLVALSALGLLVWVRHAAAREAQARLAVAVREVAAAREAALVAEGRARLLDGVLASLSDGVAVVDGDLRLAGWNPRFSECAGVPRRALRIGMPLEEILRLQAEAGEFGLVDPDREVARRMALLRTGPLTARIRRERPDGSIVELRRSALPGGGFVTLYTPMVTQAEPVADTDMLAAFTADWGARLPRLMAAAADGDARTARATAHALRGLAANAGWAALAVTLASIEAAAEAGDMPEVRAMTAMLPLDPPG
jgi:PAS domain-containing protein